MPNGFINLYKETGLTSQTAVRKVCRLIAEKTGGHMGTLDPEAEGVLPIALGKATRLIPFVEGREKAYRAELVFGLATDTDDVHGKPLSVMDASALRQEAVDVCLKSFSGPQMQIPPMYSAIKVAGKKLYEIARSGNKVVLEPRAVHVSRIALTDWRVEGHLSIAVIEVDCSKGTYIRALCRDVGEALGVPACMGRLLRTKSGPFLLQHSVNLENLAADPATHLISINTMLAKKPRISLDNNEAKRFLYGQRLAICFEDVLEIAVFSGESFLGLASVHHGVLFPCKVMAQEVELS